MPARRRVHVDVDEHRATLGVAGRQPGLLDRLPQRRVRRPLPLLDVPARLEPRTRPAVDVQHRAAGADHDGRGGEMRGVGMLRERCRQPLELREDEVARFPLTVVRGSACRYRLADREPAFFGCHARRRYADGWRREWDLNPRWVAPQWFSRPSDSAALASLRRAVYRGACTPLQAFGGGVGLRG